MKNSTKVERKSAAIMFTDIVGYTALATVDEEKAFNLIRKKRKLFQPLIKEYSGKLIKEIGDGTLSRYFNPSDAIKCANIFQLRTEDDLKVRAGIHFGEVIIDNEDVFGDVVNIASRLEAIAKPKSVLVSKETIDKLGDIKEITFIPLGLQSLKGVGRLIEVYALEDEGLNTPDPNEYKENQVKTHADDETPSIAIIPFKNKGADEDVFYAYGISADLISDCSNAGLIQVSSLSDIEKLDYMNLNNTEISETLSVRYVSQGALWKMGNMFQLSIELYDTKDSKVIWSDRWQENWENLPTIKGNLSDGLLKTLDTKPKIVQKIETTNSRAYEFYLKAKHKYEKRLNIDDAKTARDLLEKAIKLDNNLIRAKNYLGWTYSQTGEYKKSMDIYISALDQAKELDDKHEIGASLNNIGGIYWYKGNYDKAFDYYSKSFSIANELGNQSVMGKSIYSLGVIYWIKGDFDKALNNFNNSLEIAKELNDKSEMGKSYNRIGVIYGDKGDYNKALKYFNRSLIIQEEMGNNRRMANCLSNIGITYSKKGDVDRALDYYKKSLKIKEQIGDKFGMAFNIYNIGTVFSEQGNYQVALDYFEKSLEIRKTLDDKRGLGMSLYNIGDVHSIINDLDKALDYLEKSLELREELGDKRGIGYSLSKIGTIYVYKEKYGKASKILEQSLAIQKEIGLASNDLLETTSYLYLTYRQSDKQFDVRNLYELIELTENIEYTINFNLYYLLEDKHYLKTAYNQIIDKALMMEENIKDEFLRLPIIEKIVVEYNKIF